MSPTSRNTLIVGGGLIVVALLLTCGPMQSWFGQSDAVAPEAPPVVVEAPPFEPAESLGAATAGAVAGAAVGAPALEDDSSDDAEAIAAVAPVVAAAGAAGAVAAAATTPGSGGGSGVPVAAASPPPASPLPSVSAGPPAAPVAPVVLAAAGAAGSFDDAFDDDLGAAGRAVDRFAPPVAAVGGSSLAAAMAEDPFGVNSNGVRQPCDSPGSGCRNLRGPGGGGDGGPIPPRINPPIVPGVRPVPVPVNPPIIPGVRPVP